MEHSIPALVIGAIMIFAAVVIAQVANSSLETVNQSWREMEAISEERLGTELSVLSTQVDATNTQVTAVLTNEGRTSIGDFEAMDMIMNYDGADSQRHITWLPYTSAPLQDNTWTVTGISNDYHNPGVFDTGEQMTVLIQLNPATQAGPNRWLVLSTEAGVAYTVYF